MSNMSEELARRIRRELGPANDDNEPVTMLVRAQRQKIERLSAAFGERTGHKRRVKVTNLTVEEKAAIEAVKQAVRGLPRTLHISVDPDDGVISFWKRKKPDGPFAGLACSMGEQAAPDLRCKRVLTL